MWVQKTIRGLQLWARGMEDKLSLIEGRLDAIDRGISGKKSGTETGGGEDQKEPTKEDTGKATVKKARTN